MLNITTYPGNDAKLTSFGTTVPTSWANLATNITSSSWSPAIFKEGKRSNLTIEAMDVFALDFDDGTPTLQEAIASIKNLGWSALVATTKSHQKDKHGKVCDRYRVIVQLTTPLKSDQECKQMFIWFQNHFPTIDPACKDAARFYFSCTSEYIEYIEGKPVDTSLALASIPTPPAKAKLTVHQGGTAKEYKHGRLSASTLTFILDGAPEGTWNATLYKAARDCQKNNYTHEETIEKLKPATNNYNKDFDQADYKTITSAFSNENMYANWLGVNDALALFHELFFIVREPYSLLTRYYTKHSNGTIGLILQELQIPIMFQAEINKRGLLIPKDKKTEKPIYSPTDILKMASTSDKVLPIENFSKVLFASDEGYAFHRLSFDLKQGPTPAWDEFLTRLPDRAAAKFFKAWIWSAFEEKNKGRQYIWLQGEGQDGKSVVAKVLSDCFGNASFNLTGALLGKDNKFLYSNFLGKSFVAYPECKNASFGRSEIVRSLTSGDKVPIEFKGKQPFTAEIYAKLLICSNMLPDISAQRSDKSRLVCIPVKESPTKSDWEWESRLKEELPYFLHDCSIQYKHWNNFGHGDLLVPSSISAVVKEVISDSNSHLQDYLDQYFEVGEDFCCTGAEVKKVFSNVTDGKITAYTISDFKAYVEDKYGVVVKRSNGIKYLGIKIKQNKNMY